MGRRGASLRQSRSFCSRGRGVRKESRVWDQPCPAAWRSRGGNSQGEEARSDPACPGSRRRRGEPPTPTGRRKWRPERRVVEAQPLPGHLQEVPQLLNLPGQIVAPGADGFQFGVGSGRAGGEVPHRPGELGIHCVLAAAGGSGVVGLVQDQQAAGGKIPQPVPQGGGVGLIPQQGLGEDEPAVGGERVHRKPSLPPAGRQIVPVQHHHPRPKRFSISSRH